MQLILFESTLLLHIVVSCELTNNTFAFSFYIESIVKRMMIIVFYDGWCSCSCSCSWSIICFSIESTKSMGIMVRLIVDELFEENLIDLQGNL